MFVIPWSFNAGEKRYLSFRHGLLLIYLRYILSNQSLYHYLQQQCMYYWVSASLLWKLTNIYRYPRHFHNREIDYFYDKMAQCIWPGPLKWVKINLISYLEKHGRSFTGHIANHQTSLMVLFFARKNKRTYSSLSIFSWAHWTDLLCTDNLTCTIKSFKSAGKSSGK